MAEQGNTRTTTDHDDIRGWAEDHGARPAAVRETGDGDDPGVLTLDVVGYGADEDDLEHISWDDWFAKFDASDLAFVYQDQQVSGEESTFFRLVDRGES